MFDFSVITWLLMDYNTWGDSLKIDTQSQSHQKPKPVARLVL